MLYPAKIKKDGHIYSITFRDIPESRTCSDSFEDAVKKAHDALMVSSDFYFENRRTIPLPSEAQPDEIIITLLPSVFAKVLLLNTMIEQNISNVELARRMNLHTQELQLITNLEHNTKIDTIAKALRVLGKRLRISIQ